MVPGVADWTLPCTALHADNGEEKAEDQKNSGSSDLVCGRVSPEKKSQTMEFGHVVPPSTLEASLHAAFRPSEDIFGVWVSRNSGS